MLMKLCIAAAVALGCTLAVPGASFAQGGISPFHGRRAESGRCRVCTTKIIGSRCVV
jgi:hypothetical protein